MGRPMDPAFFLRLLLLSASLTGAVDAADALDAVAAKPCQVEVVEKGSGVFGSDSVQVATHGGRLFWLWGDTTLQHDPLWQSQK